MELICFYGLGLMIIIFTLCAILTGNLMYALIYLILSFVFTSCVFFLLGSYFAGALEIIIYAGAIMVLFIFVIMMFNVNKNSNYSIISYNSVIQISTSIVVSLVFVSLLIYIFFKTKRLYVYGFMIDNKQLGYKLFSDYIFIVELASILLLSALVIVMHIAKPKS